MVCFPLSLFGNISFIFAWVALYLMTYPFLNLFKGRNMAMNIKWSLIYGGTSLLFALPALYYKRGTVLYFLLAMLPLVAVNIYYVSRKMNVRC
ncbi:hypothetical protein AAUPMC_04094 [Pasteurella multocida subsp. multocida str. Anand1_cattle]|nr:hypothetical protein AAUPMC_04094 [Pasteurella multocida subsp. multocida str. Anand1_cattle]